MKMSCPGIIRSFLLCIAVVCFLHSKAQQYFNVLKYGAKNDSSANISKAVKMAIDAAVKVGGGTIYFPAGKYLTGPIHLKSNITIFIDAGAELHFSNNFDDYLPMVETRYEGVDVTGFSPLFYAYKAENIAIIGRGIIDGHGKKWWDFVEGYKDDQPRSKWQLEFDKLNKNILLPDNPAQMKRGFLRPPFIQPMYCKNVLIQGITIRNSPFWTVNPEFCDNVTIHAVSIINPQRMAPNTDGINPESCSNVRISDCFISVGDDCITIKSGKDKPGRAKAKPAENYSITNCTMLSGHGGVVIGSEMSGGVKKIAISNCIFDGTDRGIRIKTVRGRGGVVEDVRVDNIVMKNIKEQAIVLDMEYAKSVREPVTERTPVFRNIRFSNITATTNEAMYVNGIVEMPISEITLHDVVFDAKSGIVIKNARDIQLHDVRVNTEIGNSLKVENVMRLRINRFETAKPISNKAAITLHNVQEVLVENGWPFPQTKKYIEITGAETKNVFIKNNILENDWMTISKEVNTKEIQQK